MTMRNHCGRLRTYRLDPLSRLALTLPPTLIHLRLESGLVVKCSQSLDHAVALFPAGFDQGGPSATASWSNRCWLSDGCFVSNSASCIAACWQSSGTTPCDHAM